MLFSHPIDVFYPLFVKVGLVKPLFAWAHSRDGVAQRRLNELIFLQSREKVTLSTTCIYHVCV